MLDEKEITIILDYIDSNKDDDGAVDWYIITDKFGYKAINEMFYRGYLWEPEMHRIKKV